MIKYTEMRYSFEESDLVKNVVNDIAILSQNEAILQAILLRILIPRGSYQLNTKLGSEIPTLTQQKVVQMTADRIKTIVEDAIRPEIDAGNVSPDLIVNVEKSVDSIMIKIILQIIDGKKEQINLVIQ